MKTTHPALLTLKTTSTNPEFSAGIQFVAVEMHPGNVSKLKECLKLYQAAKKLSADVGCVELACDFVGVYLTKDKLDTGRTSIKDGNSLSRRRTLLNASGVRFRANVPVTEVEITSELLPWGKVETA